MAMTPETSAVTKAQYAMPVPWARPERRAHQPRALLLARVRGEFSEMPCLSLTIPQAMRLFGLREDICKRILTGLVSDGLLAKRSDDRYVSRRVGI